MLGSGGGVMSKLNVTPLVSVVKDRLQEFDAQIGGLTDSHLKWIKGYVYYTLGSKQTGFFFDNTNPEERLLIVQPLLSDGSVMSKVAWIKFKVKLFLIRNKNKPLLHPDFWPKELGLINCVVRFVRMAPKEAFYDNQPSS